ncbi:MAG: ketoacyl-ACP synthase III [Planctomycetota bacterium]
MSIAIRALQGSLDPTALGSTELQNGAIADLMAEIRDRQRVDGIRDERPVSTASFPLERIGVRSRYILDADLTARDLARMSGRRALERAQVDPERVRCVIVSSSSGEPSVPPFAATVQADLGLRDGVVAFDLSVGCSGLVVALDVASRILESCPLGSAALVIAAETMSHVMDAGDRESCAIFGDGAGAVVLERRDDVAPHHSRLYTGGNDGHKIQISDSSTEFPIYRFRSRDGEIGVERDDVDPRHVILDGRRVFRDMLRMVPKHVQAHCEESGNALESHDIVALHQANARMTGAIGETLGLTSLPGNIERFGNTSSASIPLVLDELDQDQRLQPGARILLCGFGSGYSIASASLDYVGPAA